MATHDLSSDDIARYSRQLILPDFGPLKQQKLRDSRVLVVGAGGLGCPVILYLAAAGVGVLGVADHDVVDVSNLHRQIAHTEARAGEPKAESIRAAASALNSSITVVAHCVQFTSATASELVEAYDVVVDATDNPGTRYLINDACVLAGRPLVSGAALGLNGQLSVYNFAGGPCYRCVFPDPPKRETFTSCSDGGVLGPIPGLIGCQQAMEVIKVVTGMGKPLSGRLMIYDGEDCIFRVMKLRPKVSTCAVCGDSPTISSLADSDEFCACNDVPTVEAAPVARADKEAVAVSISCLEYKAVADSGEPHVLVDVRVPVQFDIVSLPGAVNVPLSQIVKDTENSWLEAAPVLPASSATCGVTDSAGAGGATTSLPIFVVCRRGIDSLRAVDILRSRGLTSVKNLSGGTQAWHDEVDADFPKY